MNPLLNKEEIQDLFGGGTIYLDVVNKTAKAQARKIIKCGMGQCKGHIIMTDSDGVRHYYCRFDCHNCRQELSKAVEDETNPD